MLLKVFVILGYFILLPGSLWEPSIDGKSLDDSSLLVSFNPGMESAQYRIHVTSFPDEEKQCKETTHDIYEVTIFPLTFLLTQTKTETPFPHSLNNQHEPQSRESS